MTLFRAATIAYLALMYGASAAEVPDPIAAKEETEVARAHAEGAQIYECTAGPSGTQLSWQFREPIAALFRDGITVGLHYAGPQWEVGESLIGAKVSASAPSPSGKDISWLKLEVTTPADDGPLKDVTTVQRINTVGGVLEGACEKGGELRPAPYGADYVFLKKTQP